MGGGVTNCNPKAPTRNGSVKGAVGEGGDFLAQFVMPKNTTRPLTYPVRGGIGADHAFCLLAWPPAKPPRVITGVLITYRELSVCES